MVLGLATAVFIADRVMGLIPLGPQQANASVLLGVSLDGQYGDQMREVAAMATLPPAPQTLADRLNDLADSEDLDGTSVADAFCPAPSWAGLPAAKSITPRATQIRIRRFREHKLTATAVGSNGGMAIVDGQCITVGRQMDGMRLVSVDAGSLTIAGDGIEVTLNLPTD